MTTPSIDGIEVLCPACHAEPGYACTSPRFQGMTVRHHDRFVAACEAMTDTTTTWQVTDTTTWRDLADRLNPEQIRELEYCEAEQVPPGLYCPEAAVRVALGHVRANEAQQRFAHIAPPADATSTAEGWAEWTAGLWYRAMNGTVRTVTSDTARTTVDIYLTQTSDGAVERSIYVSGDDADITAAHARKVAEALLAAADEMERLEGVTPPIM